MVVWEPDQGVVTRGDHLVQMGATTGREAHDIICDSPHGNSGSGAPIGQKLAGEFVFLQPNKGPSGFRPGLNIGLNQRLALPPVPDDSTVVTEIAEMTQEDRAIRSVCPHRGIDELQHREDFASPAVWEPGAPAWLEPLLEGSIMHEGV